MSKIETQDEAAELRGTDVLDDDYKDLELDLVASSRGRKLGWNKYTIDKVTGFNDYD